MHHLDVTDPASLEAALEAAPLDTLARVVNVDGETFDLTRVSGGWYVHGDLVIASGDVAYGQPREVVLLDAEGGA